MEDNYSMHYCSLFKRKAFNLDTCLDYCHLLGLKLISSEYQVDLIWIDFVMSFKTNKQTKKTSRLAHHNRAYLHVEVAKAFGLKTLDVFGIKISKINKINTLFFVKPG